MEKRGHTNKIYYDFDTTAVCEINYTSDKWVRVTPREFRSYSGKRRYKGDIYKGPTYYYDTNILAEDFHRLKGIQFISGRDVRRTWRSKK